MLVDMKKKYRTVSGEAVTLMMSVPGRQYPIIGFVQGHSRPFCWTNEGDCDLVSTRMSLEEIPPEPTFVYLNINCTPSDLIVGGSYTTRENADSMAAPSRVGCIKVKLESRYDD